MNHTVQGTGEGEQRTLIWKEEKYTVYTDCVLCAVELMSVVEDCGVNSQQSSWTNVSEVGEDM